MTVEDVHARIEKLMLERGWSGYKLATESNVSMSTYYNMMQRDTMPKIETLEKICKGFHISLSEFFRNSEETMIELAPDELALIKGYRESDKSERERIKGYMDAMKSAKK